MIGNHGEGYKIATVVLLRLGKTVVFNNYCRREVWRPRLVKSRKYDGALVPTFFVETAAVWEKVPDHSLMIEISGISPEEYEKVTNSNLHLQGDYQKIETMYGDILESPEHKGKIFVGGLYICEEPRLDIGVDFKPCYVRLERDRNMVNSFDVCWYASKMVENAQNAELLKNLLIHTVVSTLCVSVYRKTSKMRLQKILSMNMVRRQHRLQIRKIWKP